MLLHYPWPQKGGARSDQRVGIGLTFGTRRWQELEEIITHLAGLAWSRVGRTATRMESAQPTRLLAESGLPSGTGLSPRSTTRPSIDRRCGMSSFFSPMGNRSSIKRRDIWRPTFSASCLGYRVEGKDPEGRYAYVKEIIADPHLPCLLQRVTVHANPEWLSRLKMYVLCAPHLSVGGSAHNAFGVQSCGRELLMAEKNGTWLALMCSVPFSRLS